MPFSSFLSHPSFFITATISSAVHSLALIIPAVLLSAHCSFPHFFLVNFINSFDFSYDCYAQDSDLHLWAELSPELQIN